MRTLFHFYFVVLLLSSVPTCLPLSILHPLTGSVYARPNFSFVFELSEEEKSTINEVCLVLLRLSTVTPMDVDGDGERELGCTTKITDGRGGMMITKGLAGHYSFQLRAENVKSDPIDVEITESPLKPVYFLPSNEEAISKSYSPTLAQTFRSIRESAELLCVPARLPPSRLHTPISTPSTKRTNGFQSFWLAEFLFPSVNRGTFVESGAADIHSSVTDYFEREYCWVGVGIEPINHWAVSNGVERPHMASVNGALCGEGVLGERHDFFVDSDLGEVSSSVRPSVRLSVRLSVRPSVRPSVSATFPAEKKIL